MNKNVLKTLKIIAVILIVFTLVFSLVIAHDDCHLEHCTNHNCIYCTIIHIAKTIISAVFDFYIITIIGALIYLFLARLHRIETVISKNTLVLQEVQFNE